MTPLISIFIPSLFLFYIFFSLGNKRASASLLYHTSRWESKAAGCIKVFSYLSMSV